VKTDLKKPEELRYDGPNTNFEICKYLEEIFFSVTLDLFGDPHWADPYLASVLATALWLNTRNENVKVPVRPFLSCPIWQQSKSNND